MPPACPGGGNGKGGELDATLPQADLMLPLGRQASRAAPPRSRLRNLARAELRDPMRTVVDRDTSIQVLVHLHRYARQRIAPARLLDLKHPVVQVHCVVLVHDAFLLHTGNLIQILRLLATKDVPFCAAATLNFALNSFTYSSRNSLACSSPVIPRKRSSCGSRPCQVQKLRSDHLNAQLTQGPSYLR